MHYSIYLKFHSNLPGANKLTHWGRVTHICVSNLIIIAPDNGLSPGRRQAIIWSNVGILVIGPIGTNFSETAIKIHIFSFKKIHFKMLSGKWQPICLDLNELSICFLCYPCPIFTQPSQDAIPNAAPCQSLRETNGQPQLHHALCSHRANNIFTQLRTKHQSLTTLTHWTLGDVVVILKV